MTAVNGKTYSLFADSSASDQYFQIVRELTDFLLEKNCFNENEFLQVLKASGKKKFFRNKNEKLKIISNNYFIIIVTNTRIEMINTNGCGSKLIILLSHKIKRQAM